MERLGYAWLVFVVLLLLSSAGYAERNEWDFSTNQGRASFLAAILNEDPELVSRNLQFRRDPWELFPDVDALLKKIAKPADWGIRQGVVLESMPGNVTLVYSESALTDIKATIKRDLETLKDIATLKPLAEEVAARKGDMRALRSFLRAVPFLYDSSGKLIDDAETRAAKAAERVAKLTHSQLDNSFRDLFAKHQLPIIEKAADQIAIDDLRAKLKSQMEHATGHDSLKSLSEEIAARKSEPRKLREFLRLAPLLYDDAGKPQSATVEALTYARAERLYGDLLKAHPDLGVNRSELLPDGPLKQAATSTSNYVQKEVKQAVQPERVTTGGAAPGRRELIQLQQIPPEFGMFRGCYGGDCSAHSVPFHALAPGAKIYLIRKPGTKEPVGYVFVVDVELGGKKLPYVVTVNGKVSTEMTSEIFKMIAAEYRTKEVLIPDAKHGSNNNLVNTEDIRRGFRELPVVGKQSLDLGKTWKTIDENTRSAYSNYYSQANLGNALKVTVAGNTDHVEVKHDQPLAYVARDIRTMPLFERALTAGHAGKNDPKLREVFGVSEAQSNLAAKITSLTTANPLTYADLRAAEEAFQLSWKDWAKLPKPILLASLLKMSEEERRSIKGYPGDVAIDRLGKEVLKAAEGQAATDGYEIVRKIPDNLRSEGLRQKLREYFEGLIVKMKEELAHRSPNLEKVTTLLKAIDHEKTSDTEKAEVRAALRKSLLLVPDSPALKTFMFNAVDFMGTHPLSETDALNRDALATEIFLRGDYEVTKWAVRYYFRDPGSVKHEKELIAFLDRYHKLARLLSTLTGEPGVSAAEVQRVKAQIAKDPFFENLRLESLETKYEDYSYDAMKKEKRQQIEAELRQQLKAAYLAVAYNSGKAHFWEMKELANRVFLQPNEKQYLETPLKALLQQGLDKVPHDFLKKLVERASGDATPRGYLMEYFLTKLEKEQWSDPILHPEIANALFAKTGESEDAKFAQRLIEKAQTMPAEKLQMCLGMSCKSEGGNNLIHDELKRLVAEEKFDHVLLAEGKHLELILQHGGDTERALHIIFRHPAVTLRHYGLLLKTAETHPDAVREVVNRNTHFKYPVFAGLVAALKEKGDKRIEALRAISTDECTNVWASFYQPN